MITESKNKGGATRRSTHPILRPLQKFPFSLSVRIVKPLCQHCIMSLSGLEILIKLQ